MPAGNSGNNISEVNTLMMGINAHTKHEKLAYMLLEELTWKGSSNECCNVDAGNFCIAINCKL